MCPLKSAESDKLVLHGVRTAALNHVEEFCRKNGMEPAEFMSNMGWLKDKSWKANVDWKGIVNWKKFAGFMMGGIRPVAKPQRAPPKMKK
jgi:hypothetical protein